MKKLLILSFCFPLVSSLLGQSDNIPETANNVFQIDLSKLGKKMDLNKVGSYDFLKNADSLEYGVLKSILKSLVSNMDNAGIDKEGRIINFSTEDTFRANVWVFAVKNAKKTNKELEKLNGSIKWADQKLTVIKQKKATYYVNANNSVGVAVTANRCFLVDGPYAYYYNTDDYEYEQARDSVRYIIDSIRWSKPQPEGEVMPDETTPDVVEPDYEDGAVDSSAVISGDYEEETAPAAPAYNDDYEYDSLMIAFNEFWQKKRENREKAYWQEQSKRYVNYIQNLEALPKSKSGLLYKNASFAANNSNGNDLMHWNDISMIGKEMVKSAQRNYYYSGEGEWVDSVDKMHPYHTTPLGKFIGDVTLNGGGNFDNGSMSINYKLNLSDSLKPFYHSFFKKGISPALFDVIKISNPAAISVQNTSYGRVAELIFLGMEKYYKTAEQSGHTNNNKYVGMPFFEMMYNFMDKDMLYHTFTGEGISAITGMRKSMVTYKSWEYDEEGEYVPVTKTEERSTPMFVSANTLEKPENFKKLIQPFIKYGYIEQKGNLYFLSPKMQIPDANIFMRISGNIFIITSDSQYMKEEYLQKPGGMSSTDVARLSGQSTYMELNSESMNTLMRDYQGLGASMLFNLEKVTGSISRLSLQVMENPENMGLKAEFNNKSRCSMLELLDLAEILNK